VTALVAAVLAVLAIRALRSPRVRMALGIVAGLGAALAVAGGHGAVVVVLAAVMAGGTLGAVALLHRLVVPAAFRSASGGAS